MPSPAPSLVRRRQKHLLNRVRPPWLRAADDDAHEPRVLVGGLEALGQLGGQRAHRLLALDADDAAARAGHADVGDVGGPARQHAVVGGRHVGVRAHDAGDAAVEQPAHGDLLAGRLGVEVQGDVGGVEALDDRLRLGEGGAPAGQEDVARQVDDGEAQAVALDDRHARAGVRAQVVVRAQQPRLAIEVGEDLAAVVGVVAQGDHVDAGAEQLVGGLRGDPHPARAVLAVDHDEGRLVALAQHRQQVQEDLSTRPADQVAHEKDRCCRAHHRYFDRAVMADESRQLPPPGADPMDDAQFAGHDPLAAQAPPATVAPVVVPRWVQLITLPLSIIALYLVAKAAGSVLLVFVVAAVVALILNPLVSFVERKLRFPRGLAVAAVYIALLTTLTGIGFLLANPIADQATALSRDVPDLVDSANNSLADVQEYFDDKGINIEVKRQGETAVQTLADKLGAATNDIASTATDLLKTIVTGALGLILVIVLSVYMLLYADRIGALVRRVMPPGDGSPEDDYPTRVQRAVGGYLRGQLLFSLLMGLGAGLGCWALGKLGIFDAGDDYALAFGAFFGLMELVPFLGPILGALPPVLVALFHDPISAVWVGLFFLALQQIEGHVVAPQLFGKTLRINPLLVIFALLLGGEVYGILGALVALPLAAVARETAVYLRRHLVLEPWGTPSAMQLAGGGGGAAPEP